MCTSPIPARRVNGQIEFLGRSKDHRFRDGEKAQLQIPCGQCAECRLKRSREWAVRCMHEASLHDYNCFLTLTYADEHLSSPSLKYKDFSDFIKRLRWYRPNQKFLYFAAGEYGETNPLTGIKDGGLYRPHFHAILFGVDFPDKRPARLIGKSDLFYSDELDRIWSFGNCTIGSVEFESCAYVARYAMKKVTGDLAKAHYTIVTPDGEVIEREPEMLHMSKRPAIGRAWFEKFGHQTYTHDSVVVRGKEMQPPRYYDKLLPKVIQGMIADNREKSGMSRRQDHTDARNNIRDVVVRAGLDTFNRE